MEGSSKQIIAFVLCMRAFQGIAYGQVRDGILGHPWGSSVAAIAEPLELHSARFEGNLMLYATGLKEIGDASIDHCELEFVSGRLAGVIVTTRGADNSQRLLSLLRKEYGDGKIRNPQARTWLTPETHVSYDLDTFGDAYVYWYSLRLQK
jgi:hypothetical protein